MRNKRRASPIGRQCTLVLAAAAMLGGCANRPESIRASYVAHDKFMHLDCAAVQQRLAQVRSLLASTSRLQDDKANADAVGVFLLGIPFSKLSGDHEGEVARLKGEVEAVETAQVKMNCGFRSSNSVATPEGKSAPALSTLNKLEQLKGLFDAGLITFDEYESKRKQLIEAL